MDTGWDEDEDFYEDDECTAMVFALWEKAVTEGRTFRTALPEERICCYSDIDCS